MRQRFKFYDITFSTLALVIISSKKKRETIIEDNFQGEWNIWPNQATKKATLQMWTLREESAEGGTTKALGQ